jgi:PTS system galactitol-specific IIB component
MNKQPFRILVVCGTAAVTSLVVANRIKSLLKDSNSNLTFYKSKASELNNYLDEVDLIISTVPLPSNLEIPMIQTTAFLTQENEDVVIREIMNYIKGN